MGNPNGNKNIKVEPETYAQHRREGDKNDGWTDKDRKALTLLIIQAERVIKSVVCCWGLFRLAVTCSFSNKVKKTTLFFFQVYNCALQ